MIYGEKHEMAVRFSSLYNVDLKQLRARALWHRTPGQQAESNEFQALQLEDGVEQLPNLNLEVAPPPEDNNLPTPQVDPALAVNRVEQNLEEAVRYLDSCLQIRRLYCETAKLYFDAKLKFEEFYRVDLVHQDEVLHGLYELQHKDAAQEVAALTVEKAGARKTIDLVDQMLSGSAAGNPAYFGILDQQSVDDYIARSARIARATANDAKGKVEEDSASTMKYRSGFDSANWTLTQQAAKATEAEKKAKLVAATARETYYSRDREFRARRAAVARDIAWTQIGEHCRKNSPLNYAEQLGSLRERLNENLRFLGSRVCTAAEGLARHYELEIGSPTPASGNAIDSFAMWLVKAQESFAVYKRRQRVVMLAMPRAELEQDIPSSEGAAPQPFTELTINLGKSIFGEDKALLRGVAFEYLGTFDKPISVEISPPTSAIFVQDSANSNSFLRLGRVCGYSPNSEPRPEYSEALWNGDPTGQWIIRLPANAHSKGIKTVLMYAWVALRH